MIMGSTVAKALDDLRARGALKSTDVANITAVSPATVSSVGVGVAGGFGAGAGGVGDGDGEGGF